jgi:hypothetical protein
MDCDVPPLFGYNLLQITEFLQIQIVMVTEYKPFTEWQLWLLQYPLTVQGYWMALTLSPYKATMYSIIMVTADYWKAVMVTEYKSFTECQLWLLSVKGLLRCLGYWMAIVLSVKGLLRYWVTEWH